MSDTGNKDIFDKFHFTEKSHGITDKNHKLNSSQFFCTKQFEVTQFVMHAYTCEKEKTSKSQIRVHHFAANFSIAHIPQINSQVWTCFSTHCLHLRLIRKGEISDCNLGRHLTTTADDRALLVQGWTINLQGAMVEIPKIVIAERTGKSNPCDGMV